MDFQSRYVSCSASTYVDCHSTYPYEKSIYADHHLMNVWKTVFVDEGFPNGIFHSCTLWDRAQARMKSCWEVAAAVTAIGIAWKVRSTFSPETIFRGRPKVFLRFWGRGDRCL